MCRILTYHEQVLSIKTKTLYNYR